VRPLSYWQADANRLDELAFCDRNPYPLLIHATTGYQLQTLASMSQTMDRAVLAAADRPHTSPSGIDDYVGIEVKTRDGSKRFQLTLGCNPFRDVVIDDVTVSNLHAHFTVDRHGNWYLQDASSLTGTHVNDKDPDPTQVLVSGDRLSFGMVDTVFMLPGQAYAMIRRLI
jgi:pSer/pThr/pTyr-binding forkhead associated (FHA) protein